MLPIGVTPTPTPEPVAEVKVTVEVAGSAATPDGSGKYAVAPGQQVVVTADGNVAWLGSAQGTGVTRTDVDTSATRWVSRFANPGATDGSFKLVADASGGRTKELIFTVQTGDYRSGDYVVFAANGSRQKLHIDIGKKTYDMTDEAGDKISGNLALTTEGSSFLSDRKIFPSNSSFMSLTDSIFGGFPFAVPYSAPVSYAGTPFIATRAFVLTQAKLDGLYDSARIEISSIDRESAIAQIQISGGGTVMRQCNDPHIYRIENCPPASVSTSTVEADVEPGLWILKDAVGAVLGRFGVANIEGDKIYLNAGISAVAPKQMFAIGVPAASRYADFNGAGSWATDGTVNISIVSSAPPQYVLAGAVGPEIATTLTLSPLSADGPTGIRSAINGAESYFAMRSRRVDILVGAPSPSAKKGFLHLGTIR